MALVDPRAIEVATPKQVRRMLPSWVEPVTAPKGERTTSYENIPSQWVADAIKSRAGSEMPAGSSRPPSRRATRAWSPPASTKDWKGTGMTRPITPSSGRNPDLAIDRLCAKTGDEPGRANGDV